MNLYLKNRDFALEYARNERKGTKKKIPVEDTFFLLIKDVPIEDLSNLCKVTSDFYVKRISKEMCYSLTQNILEMEDANVLDKTMVLAMAINLVKKGKNLGNKTIMDGKINTSEWISHCIWEAEVAADLADMVGLKDYKAFKYGLLHDYGRKFAHDITHITKGYDALVSLGYEEEAVGCITHSFLGGGRCAWNDPPVPGFFVDDNGIARFEDGCEKDDVTLFLENYEYTEYDNILNIADLMATGKGIVSPAERIADIATRRKEFDPRNRGYFLAELTNHLIDMSKKIGCNVPEELDKKVYAAKGVTLEEITKKFHRASEYFYAQYLRRAKRIKL